MLNHSLGTLSRHVAEMHLQLKEEPFPIDGFSFDEICYPPDHELYEPYYTREFFISPTIAIFLPLTSPK